MVIGKSKFGVSFLLRQLIVLFIFRLIPLLQCMVYIKEPIFEIFAYRIFYWVLIGITAFSYMYTGRQKEQIWETLFNVNKLEKRCLTYLTEGNDNLDIDDPNRRVKLGFGLTTDGHMISILFE